VLDAWANQLRGRGIMRIAGRIVGDDNAHDDDVLGQGWAWDYLGSGYATPSSALSFSENVVSLTLTPGASAGDPVSVESRPAGHGLTIECAAVTGGRQGDVNLDFRRLPGSARLRLTGTIPAGLAAIERFVSVDNPTLFTAGVVRAALMDRGSRVDGEAVDIDALDTPLRTDDAQVLASWTSPPLAEILKVQLKESQNLYADTLLEAVGRAAGGMMGSAEAGRKAVQESLGTWGIAPDRYVMADGSGLSRYNYLTASLLTTVLRRMFDDPRHRTPFSDALAVAGVDGTIGSRMKATRAENNARAKTGSIANVRALSGYVATAEGEPLVFSMIVNNFNVPQSEADAIIDRAVVRLAGFRRR
jgi:D-alanyl-D-alanine carboxypeptidase/D-alanyl-D-alanine-endopeptidase (penicillin-binding protein 4)